MLDKLLHWLPADTETIIVRNGPFENEPRRSAGGTSKGAGAVDPAAGDESIRRKTTLVLDGSRRFRAPHGFGPMPFEGCEICVVEESAAPALTAGMEAIRKARKTMTLSGRQVAVFSEKIEQDTWTFYVAQPRPNVYLWATHEGYLGTVLSRVQKQPSTRAMPRDLPEWKYVDMTGPIWAVRHYSKDHARKDPSSPLRGASADSAMTVPDPAAIGLVFCGDPAARRATVWYLSAAKDALAIAEKRWSPIGQQLKLKIDEVRPGVIRTTIAVGDDDLWHTFMFSLYFQLGPGAWV
jgi:hypothetical protein